MLGFHEIKDVPFIGQIVHYFPNQKEKFAAIVAEVFPLARDSGQNLQRPHVSLTVFRPNGASHTAPLFFQSEVAPINIENPETVKDQWCFVNEFATLQTEDCDDEALPGTRSNHHVGADIGL